MIDFILHPKKVNAHIKPNDTRKRGNAFKRNGFCIAVSINWKRTLSSCEAIANLSGGD
jgi:hypothetical protein